MASVSKERNSRYLFRTDAIVGFLGVVLLVLAGCTDPRIAIVPKLVEAVPPPGLVVASVSPGYAIERSPDGTRRTRATVAYVVELPRYTVERIRSVEAGLEFARRLDSVTGWATQSLPADDPLRARILDERFRIPLDALLRREVLAQGTEIPANVEIMWDRDASPEAGRIVSLPPELPGIVLEDPKVAIPAEGPEMESALGGIRTTIEELESQRAEWIERSEREARTKQSIDAWKKQFRLGAIFRSEGEGGSTPWRFVVTRGIDSQNRVDWTVLHETTPNAGARFSGALRIQPSGEVILQPRRSTVFAPPAESAADAAWLLAEPDGVRVLLGDENQVILEIPGGKSIEFRFDRSVDILPPPQSEIEPPASAAP